MTEERIALVGQVAMTVTGPDGRVVAEVHGHNRVLKQGRGLAAMALAGQVDNPTFKILLGSDGSESKDDDLKSLLKPIAEAQYTVDNASPVPAVDGAGALFRLTTTFTAKAELQVAESGIQIGLEQQRQLPKEATPSAKTAPESLGRAVNLAAGGLAVNPIALNPAALAPLAVSTLLYNRAIVTPGVTLRAGDRLTVTWTVSFVAA
jgi:hypothetical protein